MVSPAAYPVRSAVSVSSSASPGPGSRPTTSYGRSWGRRRSRRPPRCRRSWPPAGPSRSSNARGRLPPALGRGHARQRPDGGELGTGQRRVARPDHDVDVGRDPSERVDVPGSGGVTEDQRAGHEGDAEHHRQRGGDQPAQLSPEPGERGAQHQAPQGPEAVEDRVGGGVYDLAGDAAVGQQDDPVGVGGRHGVVGHHDDRLAELGHAVAEEGQQGGARGRVEVAGGLVGEDHVRAGHQGAGAGHALLLAAGELGRRVRQPVGQVERPDDGPPPLRLRCPAGQLQRQPDVLLGGQRRQEVERLEHEPEPAPEQGQGAVAEAGELGVAAVGAAAPSRRSPCRGRPRSAAGSTCPSRRAP